MKRRLSAYSGMPRGMYKRRRLIATRSILAAQAKRRRLRTQNVVNAGLLGVERKFYDTYITSFNIPAPSDCTGGEANPSSNSLTVPAQGDGATNREGKQIVGKYLLIKGEVIVSRTEANINPPNGTQVYLACVLDSQTNAETNIDSESVFTNPAGVANLAALPLRNLTYGSRYKILKDKVFTFNWPNMTQQAANDYSYSGFSIPFQWYIPLNNLKINFAVGGTTADVANVIDNSVHMIAFTNSITPQPQLRYNCRFRFIG